jgi:hypothetical protein
MLKLNNILFFIIFLITLSVSCGPSGPRSLETAGNLAFSYFLNYAMFDNRISEKLFTGPYLIEENEKEYVFQWVCKVPKPGDTFIDISVPKKSEEIKGYHIGGRKDDISFLRNTCDFPLNEAMLTNLFSLSIDPDNKSELTKRLRMVPLTNGQMEEVASFITLGWRLSQYAYMRHCHYPDSLAELLKDDLNFNKQYFIDRFGRPYFYSNLLGFIILGTAGENGKWDFDKAVLDSFYYDQMEQIHTTDDDIIVKFKPYNSCL